MDPAHHDSSNTFINTFVASLSAPVIVILASTYLLEISLHYTQYLRWLTSYRRWWLFRTTRSIIWVWMSLGLVLIVISSGLDHDCQSGAEKSKWKEKWRDPDIAGFGVRLGNTIPGIAMALALVGGQFHTEQAGVRELCMNQLGCLVYLVFNTLNTLLFREPLSLVNRLVACLSIDAVSAVVSMSFSDKDTLTSRGLIYIGTLVQLIGFVAIGSTMNSALKDETAQCTPKAFWWQPWTYAQPTTTRSFWSYFVLRFISWAHGSWLSLRYHVYYAEAEKSNNSAHQNVWNEKDEGKRYAYILSPSTAFSKYLEFLPVFLVSVLNIEIILYKMHLSDASGVIGWGQFAPLLVGWYGVCHWAWVCHKLWRVESVKGRWEVEEATRTSASSTKPSWAVVEESQLQTLQATPGSRRWSLYLWTNALYRRWLMSIWNHHPFGRLSELIPLDVPRLRDDLGFPKILKPQVINKEDINRDVMASVVLNDLQGLRMAFSRGTAVWKDFADRAQPLVRAAATGNLAIVNLLIEKGANVNVQQTDGRTALHEASHLGFMDVVDLLIYKGADVNLKASDDNNALHEASSGGYTNIVKLLIRKGADIDAQGGIYGNPLQACSAWHNEIVELLLNAGAKVNAKGGYHGSALQAASRSTGNIRTVQMLLDAGADVNIRGGRDHDHSALESASSHNCVETVRLLLPGSDSEIIRDAVRATSGKDHKEIEAMLEDELKRRQSRTQG